jgi:hypothetical protein
LRIIPGYFDLEAQMHIYFRAFHIDGEWFHASEECMALVDRIVSLARNPELLSGRILAATDEWKKFLDPSRAPTNGHPSRWIPFSKSPIGFWRTREAVRKGDVMGAVLYNHRGNTIKSLVDTISLDNYIERLVLMTMREAIEREGAR